jgi:hypothetical protein
LSAVVLIAAVALYVWGDTNSPIGFLFWMVVLAITVVVLPSSGAA